MNDSQHNVVAIRSAARSLLAHLRDVDRALGEHPGLRRLWQPVTVAGTALFIELMRHAIELERQSAAQTTCA